MLQEQVEGCEPLEDADICLQCLMSRMQGFADAHQVLCSVPRPLLPFVTRTFYSLRRGNAMQLWHGLHDPHFEIPVSAELETSQGLCMRCANDWAVWIEPNISVHTLGYATARGDPEDLGCHGWGG